MKQLKYLFISIIGLIILIPGVKADTSWYSDTYSYSSCSVYYNTNNYCIFNDIDSLYNFSDKKEILEDLYNQLITKYNSSYKQDYPYYFISWGTSLSDQTLSNELRLDPSLYVDTEGSITTFTIYMFKFIPDLDNFTSATAKSYFDYATFNIKYEHDTTTYTTSEVTEDNVLYLFAPSFMFEHGYNSSYYTYVPSRYYDSNFDLIYTYDFDVSIPDYADGLTFTKGNIIPTQKSLSLYQNTITTVNLDNYHYVLLSLKDYSQTEAFNTNLKVKGMIGITPIYNFGTTEKTTITDRCNISYSDYTDYRLYILEEDLKNNSIYAVKSCEDGSSFKFDSSIFNITYVTDDNVDDPVVVVDGQEYHTIPFNQLSNSANQNEQNNFIPGQSEETSFSDIIESVTKDLESVWNVITTFMGLVTKFFNTLPKEIRIISLTTFTTMCTLGIIKFLKG